MYICTMDEVAAMKRCIALARNSIGYHHPNPKVGCIIVHNNKSKKSELKNYENEVTKNLAEKISEEIIIYLVSS